MISEPITILNTINFSDPKLSLWEEPIKYIVEQHIKPGAASHAFIKLCNYIQQQPPFDFDSEEGRNIQIIIRNMKFHHEPVKLMEAIIYLKQSNLTISNQIKPRVAALLKKHLDPLTLAKATITLTSYGLLDENYRHTNTNFEKLLSVAILWFGDTPIAEQLKNFPHSYFNQKRFDELIEISNNMNYVSKIQEKFISSLQNFLGRMGATPTPPPPTADQITRIGRNQFLFDKNYLHGNVISKTIQKDKNELNKSRSKTEDEQTLAIFSARRMSI